MATVSITNATQLQNFMNTASPGDRGEVAPGDYVTSNNGSGQEPRMFGGFTWGVSGTAQNPIVLTRAPGAAMPRLNNRPFASSTWFNWPTMTFGDEDYITIEWMHIYGSLCVRTESASIVNGALVNGGQGIRLKHCELERGWEASGDGNWAPLRIDYYNGTIIQNCYVHDTVVDAGIAEGSSTAAVKLFAGLNTLMEFCTVANTDATTNCGGIDDKDSAIGSTYRYNWCEGLPRGNRIQNQGTAANNWRMHNNVVIVDNGGSSFVQEAGQITEYQLYNNTFIAKAGSQASGVDDGMIYAGDTDSGAKVYNNIYYGVTNDHNLTMYDSDAFSGGGLLDYNHYFRSNRIYRYSLSSPGNLANLAAFQASTGLETNATTGDPGFVDQANNDYHLAPGSALRLSANAGHVGGTSGGAEVFKGAYNDTVKGVGHGAMAPENFRLGA